MIDNLLTPEEVAVRFNESPETVMDWLRTNQFESVRRNGKWFIPEETLKSYRVAEGPLRAIVNGTDRLMDRWEWLSWQQYCDPDDEPANLRTIVRELRTIERVFTPVLNASDPDNPSRAVQSMARTLINSLAHIIGGRIR